MAIAIEPTFNCVAVKNAAEMGPHPEPRMRAAMRRRRFERGGSRPARAESPASQPAITEIQLQQAVPEVQAAIAEMQASSPAAREVVAPKPAIAEIQASRPAVGESGAPKQALAQRRLSKPGRAERRRESRPLRVERRSSRPARAERRRVLVLGDRRTYMDQAAVVGMVALVAVLLGFLAARL